MAPRVDTSQRVEQLLHNYYDYLSRTPWIAPIVSRYEKTKHSHDYVEEGLDRIETSLVTVSTLILSLSLWTINTFYVIPTRKITKWTKKVIEWTSGIVKRVSGFIVDVITLSIGIFVVSVQSIATLLIGVVSIGLDVVEEVKRFMTNGIEWSRETGTQIHYYSSQLIGMSVGIVIVPLTILADSVHSLLDLIEGFVHNNMQMPVKETVDASILTRIHSILTALSTGLSFRAHFHVIDPAHSHIESLVEQTKKSLIVLEIIRKRGEWAVERVDNVSTAVQQWKTKIEEEARQYRVCPEVILLKALHSSTLSLTHNIITLRDKNSKVFGDGVLLDRLICQLERVVSSLRDKNDIYEVRDDLITHTTNQLVSLSHSLRQ